VCNDDDADVPVIVIVATRIVAVDISAIVVVTVSIAAVVDVSIIVVVTVLVVVMLESALIVVCITVKSATNSDVRPVNVMR
jgi:hypothetical protein